MLFFYDALFSAIIDWHKELDCLKKECFDRQWYSLSIYAITKFTAIIGKLVPSIFVCLVSFTMANETGSLPVFDYISDHILCR